MNAVPTRLVSGTFDLVDDDGKSVTDSTYHGQWKVVFFGFTHCRMVCPRALKRLSSVLDRIGSLADDVRPLYITVDPERDTPRVMKDFLAEDYPRFTGLTGTRAQIDRAKQSFRVFSTTVSDSDDPDGYQMPHSAFTFVLAPTGAYRTHFTDAVREDELVEQLKAVLGAS